MIAESVNAEPSVSPVSLKPPIGMFPVKTWVPSFRMQVERPVAKSAVKELNAVDEITVPVTTGWPAVLIEKVPLEKDICYPSSVEWIATPLGVMLFWWLSRRNGFPSGGPRGGGGGGGGAERPR